MSEILVASGVGDGSVTTVPDTPEQKAKQLPDPSTYHILCALPEIEEKFDSGIVKAGQTIHFEELLPPCCG